MLFQSLDISGNIDRIRNVLSRKEELNSRWNYLIQVQLLIWHPITLKLKNTTVVMPILDNSEAIRIGKHDFE